jgi:uncharacterized protein (TIGR00730 family)
MSHSPTSICVYCGSSPGALPVYREAAVALGAAIAARGIALIYGGGRVGLMGAVADSALAAGGRVTGVIPRALLERELGHGGVTELLVVRDMHERKQRMASLADAFIALPGGWGTLEELTEMITWNQLGLQTKPIGLLNIAAYYDHFLVFAEQMIEQQFVRPEQRNLLRVASTVESMLDQLSCGT